jgi:hypothetical protein
MTYLTLAALGAFHGLNPAMGWLFAVALGLQERRRSAVLCAIPPIALGHAASVLIVVALVSAARLVVSPIALRLTGGAALVTFGAYKLLRRGAHPRWVGMRVGFRDLTLWSFLMSSAHGAGLMLVPVLLQLPASHAGGHAHALATTSAAGALAALAVHTTAMLVVMAGTAVAVFEVLGLELLRRAWINLDVAWAGALIVAGAVTLVAR